MDSLHKMPLECSTNGPWDPPIRREGSPFHFPLPKPRFFKPSRTSLPTTPDGVALLIRLQNTKVRSFVFFSAVVATPPSPAPPVAADMPASQWRPPKDGVPRSLSLKARRKQGKKEEEEEVKVRRSYNSIRRRITTRIRNFRMIQRCNICGVHERGWGKCGTLWEGGGRRRRVAVDVLTLYLRSTKTGHFSTASIPQQ